MTIASTVFFVDIFEKMITYKTSNFGFNLILRVHGSAVWKAFLPALFSTGVLPLYLYLAGWEVEKNTIYNDNKFMDHPYVIGAFIAFFSFLLSFRLNYAYQRVSFNRCRPWLVHLITIPQVSPLAFKVLGRHYSCTPHVVKGKCQFICARRAQSYGIYYFSFRLELSSYASRRIWPVSITSANNMTGIDRLHSLDTAIYETLPEKEKERLK